uniref:Protein HEXIM2 n=1 Tax=Sus scrofa TaxID=9823 RepID=A0A480GJT9_PIG
MGLLLGSAWRGSTPRCPAPHPGGCPLGSTSHSPAEAAGSPSGASLLRRPTPPPGARAAGWCTPAAAAASSSPPPPVTAASPDPGSRAPAPACCGPAGSRCDSARRPRRSPSAGTPREPGPAHHCPLPHSPRWSLGGRPPGAHPGWAPQGLGRSSGTGWCCRVPQAGPWRTSPLGPGRPSGSASHPAVASQPSSAPGRAASAACALKAAGGASSGPVRPPLSSPLGSESRDPYRSSPGHLQPQEDLPPLSGSPSGVSGAGNLQGHEAQGMFWGSQEHQRSWPPPGLLVTLYYRWAGLE